MSFRKITNRREFEEHYKSGIWLAAAKEICGRHNISFTGLRRSEGSEHIVFFVDDTFIVKIFAPFRRCFEREKTGLEFARGKTHLPVPEIVAAGKIEGFDYLVTTQLAGSSLTRETWLTLPEKEQYRVIIELACGLREIHSHDAEGLNFEWKKFVEHQSNIAVKRQIANNVNPEWINRLPEFIETNLPFLPVDVAPVFLHGDIHFGNLRLQDRGGKWEISGLFDFADSLGGFHEFDFVAIGLLMIQGQSRVQREFFRAYGYAEHQLDESLRRRLMLMTVLYECSDLGRYARRLKPEAVNFTFDELERAIWNFNE